MSENKGEKTLQRVDVADSDMTFTDRGVRLDSPAAAVNFAKWCYESGYLPEHIKSAKQAFAILARGAELGLPPFAAWRFVYMTKGGRLALETEGALAVCQASPVFEDYTERIEGSGNDMKAVAAAKRKGRSLVVKEFTYAQALRAGLLKPGRTRDGREFDTVWQSYLEDMLLARARGRALRQAFTDVLGGIPVRGEAEDIDRQRVEDRRDEPAPEQLGPGQDHLLEALLPAEAPAPTPEQEVSPRERAVIDAQVDEVLGPEGQKQMPEEPPEPEGIAPQIAECQGCGTCYAIDREGCPECGLKKGGAPGKPAPPPEPEPDGLFAQLVKDQEK
jgi:hypothetical protein